MRILLRRTERFRRTERCVVQNSIGGQPPFVLLGGRCGFAFGGPGDQFFDVEADPGNADRVGHVNLLLIATSL